MKAFEVTYDNPDETDPTGEPLPERLPFGTYHTKEEAEEAAKKAKQHYQNVKVEVIASTSSKSAPHGFTSEGQNWNYSKQESIVTDLGETCVLTAVVYPVKTEADHSPSPDTEWHAELWWDVDSSVEQLAAPRRKFPSLEDATRALAGTMRVLIEGSRRKGVTTGATADFKRGAKVTLQKDFGFLHKGETATVTQVRKSPEGHTILQLRNDSGRVQSLTIKKGEDMKSNLVLASEQLDVVIFYDDHMSWYKISRETALKILAEPNADYHVDTIISDGKYVTSDADDDWDDNYEREADLEYDDSGDRKSWWKQVGKQEWEEALSD
jgi:hypothetical protein